MVWPILAPTSKHVGAAPMKGLEDRPKPWSDQRLASDHDNAEVVASTSMMARRAGLTVHVLTPVGELADWPLIAEDIAAPSALHQTEHPAPHLWTL